jgi:RNA recognition motif-containing protein
MADSSEAQRAIQALDGHIINGRALAVKEAEQRTDNRPNPRPAYPPRENAPTRSTDAIVPRTDVRALDEDDSSPVSSFILPKVEPRKKTKDKERKVEEDNRTKKAKIHGFLSKTKTTWTMICSITKSQTKTISLTKTKTKTISKNCQVHNSAITLNFARHGCFLR